MLGLARKQEGCGVDCSRNGLTLAGVPLLRREANGLAPRPEAEIRRLVEGAYGSQIDPARLMGGLQVIAQALNAGRITRAMIAAAQLDLPALDENGADRIAKAESALEKAGFNPDEPRDEHGRWTDDDWVHLPPGERIDELGDFLEWIANAKPSDEQTIRSEIRRYFYKVGDTVGGNALNRALSEALQPDIDRQGRQEILRAYEPYTRTDPAEVAQFRFGLMGLGVEEPAAAVEAEPAWLAERAKVWRLGWSARSFAIEKELGISRKLARNFPVIDDFLHGIATSVKSIDLRAAVYQDGRVLARRINRYVDQLARFQRAELKEIKIVPKDIVGRVLHLVVPDGHVTQEQQEIIETATKRAEDRSVRLNVSRF